MRTTLAALLLWAAGLLPCHGEEVVRIAYIDPLGGALADTGALGEQHLRFAADRVNAAQAAGPGIRFEIVPMDNGGSAQATSALLRRAAEQGIHYVTQGQGSAAAFALVDAIQKNNARDPAHTVLYLNYAAVDPALTNAQCSWWQFRFDADTDMKMRALAEFIAGQHDIHRVWLLNQDYSFGAAVEAAAQTDLAGRRADLQVVGADRVPLARVMDFTPYIAKMQAAGADAVVTGNWGPDLALLVKAAAENGFHARFFTYYIGEEAMIAAAGSAATGDVQVATWANNLAETAPVADAFEARFGRGLSFWNIVSEIDTLAAAMKQAHSTDPARVAAAMSGMVRQTALGPVEMRADDHQLLQPLFLSEVAPGLPHHYPQNGLGMRTIARIAPEATRLPTTCRYPDKPAG